MKDDLLTWLSGVLRPEDVEAFEERLFSDDALRDEALLLLAVRDGLRSMAAEGPIVPVLTAAELKALRKHAKVTEHHPRGGVIQSRIQDEDFVAAFVPIASVPERLHVLFCTPAGEPYFRVHDAPFDPESREVIILCKRHVALEAGRLIVRVVNDGEAVLGEVAIEDLGPP